MYSLLEDETIALVTLSTQLTKHVRELSALDALLFSIYQQIKNSNKEELWLWLQKSVIAV